MEKKKTKQFEINGKKYPFLRYKDQWVFPMFQVYAEGMGSPVAMILYYADGKDIDYYGDVTVNLPDCKRSAGCQFINTDKNPDIPKWLEENKFGNFTGKEGRSGYCKYPEFDFYKGDNFWKYRLYSQKIEAYDERRSLKENTSNFDRKPADKPLSFDKEQDYGLKLTKQEKQDIENVRNNDLESMIYFQTLPKQRRTEAVSLEAVRNLSYNLAYVPQDNKTPEMCRIALKGVSGSVNTATLLAYVPFADVCLEVMKEKSAEVNLHDMVVSIKPEAMSQETVDWILERDAKCFNVLPKKCQTFDNAIKAVQTGGSKALSSIPEKLQTTELLQEAKLTDLMPDCKKNEGDITAKRCLAIEMKHPGFFKKNADLLPERISSTQNVYTAYIKNNEKQESGKKVIPGSKRFKL